MTLTSRTAGIIVVAVLAGGLFVAGRLTSPRGLSPADAAALVRHAGDSAVASYSKSVASVIGPLLEDSVRSYHGTAQAGAKVVVRHDAGAVHDAAALPAVQTSAPIDTSAVVLPVVSSGGVTAAETLHVAPRPAFLGRALHLSVDPDTILVALLQTPEGLQRFTAAGSRAGLHMTVVDAAAIAPNDNRTLKAAVTAGAMVGCAVAGYELGRGRDGSGVALAIGGTICAGGALIRIRF